MSICNSLITQSFAEIYTDTLCFNVDEGRAFRTTKISILPHIRTAACYQGSASFGASLTMALYRVGKKGSSIDAIPTDVIHDAQSLMEDAFPFPVYGSRSIDERVQIIGWSDNNNMPLIIEHSKDAGVWVPPKCKGAVPGTSFAYHSCSLGFTHLNYTEGEFIALAEAQRLYFKRALGYQGVGGELIKTTLTKGGIQSKIVHAWKEDEALLRGA